MAHMLAKLRGVKPDIIKQVLVNDSDIHAKEGLFLEHLWQNKDDADEVLFLFRTFDLRQARQFIDRVHKQTLINNPDAKLPVMTYLEEL
jgi:hypothetical protein